MAIILSNDDFADDLNSRTKQSELLKTTKLVF